MKSISIWKVVLTILLIIIATLYVIPNFTEKKYNWLPGDKVNLGLDLRGGSHLLLDVDFESYLDGVGQSIADSLKKYLRQEKVGYKTLVIDKANINFEIKSVDDFTEVKKIVKKIDPNIDVGINGNIVIIGYDEYQLNQLTPELSPTTGETSHATAQGEKISPPSRRKFGHSLRVIFGSGPARRWVVVVEYGAALGAHQAGVAGGLAALVELAPDLAQRKVSWSRASSSAPGHSDS